MKKIIIIGTIMIMIITSGFIVFKGANKDNLIADNKIVNKVNNVDEKDNKDDKNGDIEENLIVEEKEEKVPDKNNSGNTSKNDEKKDTSNNNSNKKDIPNSNQNKESTNNSNSSNNNKPTSNNNQSNNVVQPKEKTAWEKLGITEDQYHNSPMISWQRVDFSVNTYGSMDKTVAACKKHGEEYVNNHDGGFSCTNVYSYSGRYLGEYFKFFELES